MTATPRIDTPRIVIAAEFWFGASGAGLAHGFRQLGWDAGEVDLREHSIQGRGSTALRVAARLLHGQCVASFNRAVLQQVEALEPRAFLTVKGSLLLPATLAEIRRRGVPTVNYYPDFHFDYTGLDQATFAHYDLFVTTKSFQVPYLTEMLGAKRVRLLHHGYSSLVHRPRGAKVAGDDYVADVLYVGNHSPYKQRWLEAVARGLPDVKLMIIGNGWCQAAGAQNLPRAKFCLIGDSYARVIEQSRINLAIHSGPTGLNGWEDLVSTRTFEIPACKGFMLHIDNEEVRALFEPGKEIDVFSTPDALCEKIRHYLPRPDLRKSMIDSAFARCVPAYSYDARAQAIAEMINARNPDRAA